MSGLDEKGLEWPERLTLRDTRVIADEGQRIFTTATGYGYEKREYVRADLASVTPADVGELVERLRHHAAVFGDYECVMRQWDLWRAMIAKGHRGSLPRDGFESLIDNLDKAADRARRALSQEGSDA